MPEHYEIVLTGSCYMAFAALMHDIGKFAERARIPEASGQTRETSIALYCPAPMGNPTHIHAAYSGIALEAMEPLLPPGLLGLPELFGSYRMTHDDSILNAAAKHHRPETFLQWVIAAADRLASGFERETFKSYNEANEKPNHYATRLWPLLEQIRLEGKPPLEAPSFRLPLQPLAPEALFPVKADVCEQKDNRQAQKEYLTLWEGFLQGLEHIPEGLRQIIPLWLDHFESLWLCFSHAIPSATAGSVRPEVSLFDHTKATAALAVALWRFHHDQGHDPEEIRSCFRAQWDTDTRRREDPKNQHAWKEKAFLLIQGDFFGIQDFIFASGGSTQKHAAKLLRGRSFYVSLLMECAALKVLEALGLPSTSQVTNAAGKFLIVAPNTPQAHEKLRTIQQKLNQWFLEHTFGQSGIGLAWLPSCASDFLQAQEEGNPSPFQGLMSRLFEKLDEAKNQRFGLCQETPQQPVFEEFLDAFEHGECQVDGKSPAKRELKGEWLSALAYDQIQTGQCLIRNDRVLLTKERIPGISGVHTLELSLFGFHVAFMESAQIESLLESKAVTGRLLRLWDFSLPKDDFEPLWNGHARRFLNAYVPRHQAGDGDQSDRYLGLEELDDGDVKTLNHIARDDRELLQDQEKRRWQGIEALMTFKGDVDNLGLIIRLKNQTFAKMAGLSRQMNAFFATWLPWECEKNFPSTYTVFAGGDDFFLIGPWLSTIRLAQDMRHQFRRFVAENDHIHFSAGLSMTKPGFPIGHLAHLAEQALDEAKGFNPNKIEKPPKNSVNIFGESVFWKQMDSLLELEEDLRKLTQEVELSTGYLYDLLRFAEMAGKVSKHPENALWHAYFAYRTRRLLEAKIKGGTDPKETEAKRQAMHQQLAEIIAHRGIETFEHKFKIPLFTLLYRQRD